MNCILLGATGFIGINLIRELTKNKDNRIIAVGRNREQLDALKKMNFPNLHLVYSNLAETTDFETLIKGQEIVYHLLSTTIPSTSNRVIEDELRDNVLLSVKLFEACAHQQVKKIVFFSSGGTVYGKEVACPLAEDTPTNPITSYGIQKITIEKLLYLYHYMYGVDYRIIRLSNPYGPYQRPNGGLGAVTTFTYKALRGEKIQVFGDGTVVRDFIYIDDAVRGILKIVKGNSNHRVFNLGCGYGTSINQLLVTIEKALRLRLNVQYIDARDVDVPVNYLDISRFESEYGELKPLSLEEGIVKTAEFIRNNYSI